LLQFLLCLPAVNALLGKVGSAREIVCHVANQEGSGCCHNYQSPSFVATRPGKNVGYDLSIGAGISSTQMIKHATSQPKIGGLKLKRSDLSRSGLAYERLAGQRYFVEAIIAMDHPGALGPEGCQDLSEMRDKIFPPDANYLPRRTRWITQGTKQIECSVHSKLAANTRHPRGRSVIKRRKHETDADFPEGTLRNFGQR
jgi:hypothetical protein